MPVHHKPRWIGVTVGDAATAVGRSGFNDVELVVEVVLPRLDLAVVRAFLSAPRAVH